MKISQGITENGIQVGNYYDKYASKNPIARTLMHQFNKSLDSLVEQTNVKSLHEIGCGEGYLALRWLSQGKNVRACDFSAHAIQLARQNAIEKNFDPSIFTKKSIYALTDKDQSPLVVCCEVLEHLEYPEVALKELVKIAQPWLILSVPREPMWSLLNMARGKYIRHLGNTPGHIQKWTKTSFIKMVSQYVEVVDVKAPLPWTMLLCKVQNN
jgi:2-polyprenyl-3-methyl-5-hydroxy-6-metoxy-1,4-benzoquinol methylase